MNIIKIHITKINFHLLSINKIYSSFIKLLKVINIYIAN